MIPGTGRHADPGTLTAEMMQPLAVAVGVDFERLFLAGMVRHHEGALIMVKELFASTGAGQEPEIFRFPRPHLAVL